ncbi:DUF3108 domain-containing protein [Methylotenera sp. G11]|uniref:DUF3108 domain-containing protein n=1 Tax=Methylotenera sp. G11 TaxID=1506585 RepID=UPI00064921B1|nr:DUF3108 domain-containing protein [Methylotenera sp. G11]
MQHKMLLLAAVGSILLHIAFLSEFSISLPQMADDAQSLDMHLVQQQPAPSTSQPAGKTSQPKPEQRAPKANIPPPPLAEEPPAPANANNPIEDNAPSPPADTGEAANAPATTTEPPETSETVSAPAEDVPAKPAYRHVETEFKVLRGGDTSAVGVSKIVFNIDADGRYSIISTTQAKGLASLFFGNLTQKSEGTVTADGLRPEFYSYLYGSNANKSQTANFDWTNNILHMHSAKGDSTAKLVTGTQDFLSFMYQFMFVPPLDSMQITMTNGKRLRTYAYSFEGEDTVATGLGELKTVHLLKSSGDEEKTEVWLASDYQYLPVRIRKTEKDGTVIEQVAAAIKTSVPD